MCTTALMTTRSLRIFTYFNNVLLHNYRNNGDRYHVIFGDFNVIMNPTLNKMRIQLKNDPKNPYFNNNKIGTDSLIG